jgi:hypothetical protein
VTTSRFGPSGSLIRKNTNLEIAKEIIRRISKGIFFIQLLLSASLLYFNKVWFERKNTDILGALQV